MNQEPSFFDKRTVLAMGFVFVGILGWNFYLSKKYPKTITTAEATPAVEVKNDSTNKNLQVENKAGATEKASSPNDLSTATEEKIYKYEDEKLSFEISSRGMGLRNIVVKSHTQRDGSPVVIGEDLANQYIFETQYKNSEKINFRMDTSVSNRVIGFAQVGGSQIEKTYEIDPAGHKLLISTKVTNPTTSLVTTLVENISKSKSTSFLLPSYDFESLYIGYEGTNKKVDIREDAEVVLEEALQNVSVASLGGHYFTSAIVDESPIAPTITTSIVNNPSGKQAIGFLQYDFADNTRTYNLKQTAFIGPKDLKLLGSVSPQLEGVVNYGMFSWIAIPILKLLQFFYGLVGNYGVAIILVTLLIRVLLMPINISSYKSMKSMQKVQPLLKAVKEKYKNDPKRLQVETMNIMKENKVNPLGGCLPMLLQLPIFIALYNVLAQSIELYQAPFMLWIYDLSSKDPYYILPILMGISMFVQQKITPTAMDPAQAKAMQIMPVIFSLLMITLPSGLTLYIFVSTVFGIVQQYLFMNEKKPSNIMTINAK